MRSDGGFLPYLPRQALKGQAHIQKFQSKPHLLLSRAVSHGLSDGSVKLIHGFPYNSPDKPLKCHTGFSDVRLRQYHPKSIPAVHNKAFPGQILPHHLHRIQTIHAENGWSGAHTVHTHQGYICGRPFPDTLCHFHWRTPLKMYGSYPI